MDSILFSGCSFTYGEGLWRETKDTHQNSINQKYLIENRWITKVSNHFNKNCISKQWNGGNNMGSIKYTMDEIDAMSWNENNIKLLIFQTTQFGRHAMSINEQVDTIENMVINLENKNIPVRFIHWMWPDVTESELKLLSDNNIDNKLSSEIVRDRTIYILNNFNFDTMTDPGSYKKIGSNSNKYTLAAKFNCNDFHMNQEGHDVLANEIINYIEKNKLL